MPKPGQVGPRPGDIVPSLAALIPKASANANKPASSTNWVKSSESFFSTWKKIAPCMPTYAKFIQLHKDQGLDVGNGFLEDSKLARNALAGRVHTQESVLVALGKFYLHVAMQLRPEEVEAAGSDSESLLKIAQKCAEEDLEPFIENARQLVSDYDQKLHKDLEETSPWYEVDEGLFWQANFDVAAPAAFQHFLTAVGHGSGQGYVDGKAHAFPKDVARHTELVQTGLSSSDPAFEPARRAAEVVYEKWLEASSMPVKASIKQLLSEHGLIVSTDVHDADILMPELMPQVMSGGIGGARLAM